MRVLLDTCVLADLRRPDGHPAVKAAVALIPDDDLYISGLTLGEVRGVSSLPEGRKKRKLRAWLAGLQNRFADRILGVDHETTQLWGEIVERTQRTGHLLHMVDGLLAATALSAGFIS